MLYTIFFIISAFTFIVIYYKKSMTAINKKKKFPGHDYIKKLSDNDNELNMICIRAGKRSQSFVIKLILTRFVAAIAGFFIGIFYFILTNPDLKDSKIIFYGLGGAALGFLGPKLYVEKMANNRIIVLEKAFPDVVDLLIMCIGAGMSIEIALRRVKEEIENQYPECAEELLLMLNEVSILRDRSDAYFNLGKRTGSDLYRSLGAALNQSEVYGTPLLQTMQVLSKETRSLVLLELERRAMALSPKMTVPMMVFFMPGVFVAILTPLLVRSNFNF